MEHQVELVFQATRRDGKRLGYVSWAVLVACLDFEVASILFHMGHINWVCQMCRMLFLCQIWNWAGRLWSKDCPASVLYCVSSWSWWSLSSTREWLWIWGGYNMVEFPHQLLQKEHQLETWVMGIESLQSLNLNHLLMRGLEQGKNLKPVRTGRSQNQKLCFKRTESHLSDVNTSKLQSLCPIRCHDWKFYRRRCGWELWQ